MHYVELFVRRLDICSSCLASRRHESRLSQRTEQLTACTVLLQLSRAELPTATHQAANRIGA